MADSPDFTKKILVDVQLKSEQIKNDLPALTAEIDRLTASQKAAQKAGETSTKAYIDNASQLRNLKAELRDSNKYIDNVSKAVNAQTGSIQQNRAILSVATADYIKLNQAEGKTADSTVKLGKNISDLTVKLKDQEKQIGQTYRNVGNYEGAINGLVEKLGGALPVFKEFQEGFKTVAGFGQFIPSVGQNIANGITSMFKSQSGNQQSTPQPGFAGFKQFSNDGGQEAAAAKEVAEESEAAAAGETAAGEAAETAAGGMSVLGVAITAVIGVIAGALAVIVALKEYLSDIAPVSDKLSDVWAGMKASFVSMANSIRQGDFSNLASNMSDADTKARALNQDIIDLNRNLQVSDVATAKENDFIAVQMLKLRNIHTTADQATKIFDGIQETAEKQYQRTWHLAFDGYRAYAGQIINAAGLTQKEYDKLLQGGVAYATQLQKNGAHVSDELIKNLAEYEKKLVEANGVREQVTQRAENREQQRQQRDQQQAQSAAEKAERQHEKEAAALLEAENLRKASLTRQLQDIYEAYGSQTVAADQKYNDELTKLKKFVAQKLITQQEANSVEKQLTAEHTATIAKIIQDFQKQDFKAYQDAANALTDLQIQGIQNVTQKTIEGLQQRGIEQKEQLDLENTALVKQIDQLEVLITHSHGVEQAEAIKHRDNLLAIWQVNKDKAVELAKQEAEAIAKVKRDAQEQAGQAVLGADVLQAKRGNNVFDKNGAEDAEKAQVTDKYDFEISEAARAGQSTVLLEQQKIDALKAINDRYLAEKINYAVEAEQTVQSGIMGILQQGVQSQLNATMKGLENQKDAALQNTSLTGTQKQLINQKYTNLENAAKLKAFKADQKLQAANIIINGAVAITKTIAEMGFLPAIPFVALTAATTALSLSKVLSQKPAFAQGGQFKSDGRGALLPGYSKYDNTNATLRSGEAVVVSEAMRAPWARNTISRINEMFGGRSFATSSGPKPAFADGGIFTDGGNANRYYAQPVTAAGDLANSLAYQLINNFPPVFVDVKDINNQQGILAQTQNRVVL